MPRACLNETTKTIKNHISRIEWNPTRSRQADNKKALCQTKSWFWMILVGRFQAFSSIQRPVCGAITYLPWLLRPQVSWVWEELPYDRWCHYESEPSLLTSGNKRYQKVLKQITTWSNLDMCCVPFEHGPGTVTNPTEHVAGRSSSCSRAGRLGPPEMAGLLPKPKTPSSRMEKVGWHLLSCWISAVFSWENR